jgi:hypothetical protein
MKIQLALMLALLSPAGAALAQTPASSGRSTAQTLEPVGTYDLSFVKDGEAATGVLTISRDSAGNLKGTLEAHDHTFPLNTVTVAGRDVTIKDDTDLSITLTLAEDNSVTGKWSGHGDSGTFTAVRRQR